MYEQLDLERPFGYEGLKFSIQFQHPWGWLWDAWEWNGHGWVILEQGTASNLAKSLRDLQRSLNELEAVELGYC